MRKVFIVAAICAAIATPSVVNAQGFPAFQNGPVENTSAPQTIAISGRSSVRDAYVPARQNRVETQRPVSASDYYYPPFLPF